MTTVSPLGCWLWPPGPDARARRVYRLAFILCAAVAIAPLWAGVVLPFQDYGGNMSYAAIIAGARHAGSLYARTYHVGGWWLPNGLFLHAWAWLGGLVGFLVAGKLLIAVYIVLPPLSLEKLLGTLGRDHRFALLAFPMAFNDNLIMGFMSYVTSLPLLIYTLTLAFRFRDETTWRRGALVTLFAMLTFLGHAQMYLILGIAAFGFIAFEARSLRRLFVLAAPFAASLTIFIPWAWVQFIAPPDASALGGRPLEPYYPPAADLFSHWGTYTICRWTASFDDWTYLAILGVFAVGLACRQGSRQLGRGRGRYAIEAITVLMALGYLVVPEHTLVQAAIASRLVIVTMLLGVAWLYMPRTRLLQHALVGAMVVISCFFSVHVGRAIASYNQHEIGPRLLPLIKSLPRGSKVAILIEDQWSETVTAHPHAHMEGYLFVLDHGLTWSGFDSYYGRAAWWRKGYAPPYPGRDTNVFLEHKGVCWYDYLLVRTRTMPHWGHFARRLTFIGKSADYSLWKIEHDAIPDCQLRRAAPKIVETKSRAPHRPSPAQEALSDTYGPTVGHARGRDLDGHWRSERPSTRPARRPEPARSPRHALGRPAIVPVPPVGLHMERKARLLTPSPLRLLIPRSLRAIFDRGRLSPVLAPRGGLNRGAIKPGGRPPATRARGVRPTPRGGLNRGAIKPGGRPPATRARGGD